MNDLDLEAENKRLKKQLDNYINNHYAMERIAVECPRIIEQFINSSKISIANKTFDLVEKDTKINGTSECRELINYLKKAIINEYKKSIIHLNNELKSLLVILDNPVNFEFKDFKFNSVSREVIYKSKKMQLTKKESLILESLCRSPNVYKHIEIIGKDTALSRLRAKTGLPIESKRNYGVRLVISI